MRAPIRADTAPARTKPSNYPPPYAERMNGRTKRALGDLFGLNNFGVNLTELIPGSASALQHVHSRQDEFIYVLEGKVCLVSGDCEFELRSGMCVGFPANSESHHLENRSNEIAVILEVGDRSHGDIVSYPLDDLSAVEQEGRWVFVHKDGSPY